jgi:hypothetical protein
MISLQISSNRPVNPRFLSFKGHEEQRILRGKSHAREGHAASSLHNLPVDIVAAALHQALRHVATVEQEVAHSGNSEQKSTTIDYKYEHTMDISMIIRTQIFNFTGSDNKWF